MTPRLGKSATSLALFILALACWPAPAPAGHGDKDKHQRSKGKESAPAPALNQTYEQECGACHWAYFPGLLPARSWEKILAQPGDHFGEQLPTSPGDLGLVRDHLLANAADKSSNKRSGKIMKSIGSATPLRVSQIAYLRDKHRGIGEEILQRKSVGGLGNCLACHPGAKGGDFDEDRAAIPR